MYLIVYYVFNIITLCEFFSQALADGFSLETE